MHVVQEFYCSGCDGYFRVRLNQEWTARVEVECPKCQRRHERQIENGVIKDVYKEHQNVITVMPVPSSYSKEAMLNTSLNFMRHGNVVDRQLINERWTELYGDRV